MSEILKSKPVKAIVATMAVAVIAILTFVTVTPAYAQITVPQPSGTVSGDGDINDTIVRIANIVTGVVGGIAVLMLIYGGLRYIISQGNEDDIEKAKNIILYAIVGIVVIMISYIVVLGVVNLTSGVGSGN